MTCSSQSHNEDIALGTLRHLTLLLETHMRHASWSLQNEPRFQSMGPTPFLALSEANSQRIRSIKLKTNSLDGQRFHRGEQCDVPWFGVALAFRRLAFSRSRFRILTKCRLAIATPQMLLHTNVDARIPPSLDIADGHAGGGGHLRLKVLHSRDADTESWQGAGFRPQPRERSSLHM